MQSQSFSPSARIPTTTLGAVVVVAVALFATPLPAAVAKAPVQVHSTAAPRAIAQGQTTHRTSPLKDSDRDGLADVTEVRRTRTNPRKADTDGDGLSDGTEFRHTRTNPRKVDTDGDGVSDGAEVLAGTNPLDPTSFPGPPQPGPVDPEPPTPPTPPEPETDPPPPPADTTPPNTTIGSKPPATTTDTSASFEFSSTEAGSSFECKLDAGGYGSCTSPKSYSGRSIGDHIFSVRATDKAGNVDPTSATWSWTIESSSPPTDTTPPNTMVTAAPPATTTSTSASFSFNSTEGGSSFECKLDGAAAFSSCSSPKPYSGLLVGDHDFQVRAPDAAGNVDPSPASQDWTIETAPPPPPSGCVAGATQATTAAQVRSAVQGNHDVCVTANVGNVNLEGLGSRPVVVSTNGGSMGYVNITNTTNLTIRSARFESAELWYANGTTIEDSVIGGTASNRITDNLVNVNVSDDVTIKSNELAWTTTSGTTTGYGIRSPGNELGYNDRLHIEGNYIHHISADAIQGLGNRAEDVVIDRNRIDYVGKNPGSDEHSDGMQIINHGGNTRITNNWISHEGFYAEGQPNGSSGTLYVHGDGNGNKGALIIENNLFSDSQGRVEITGLGTGGTSMSNIVIRRNTFSNLGLGYTGFPGLRWAATSGASNVVERNVAVDPDGGFAQNGSAGIATFTANLWGQASLVTLDSQGNCTSSSCNPSGQEAIGYRKPSGVDW
jgi:hypothetical protein